jgi:hypothetical protein
MTKGTSPLGPRRKALEINLDPSHYGTFAEIGAGQEVVRWFFTVGGAAGTVSKSMSAYDMAVSDAIYGSCDRYVSRARLEAMLEHEHRLNIERLTGERGATTAFFAFADTVAARSYKRTNECHGWMGIRFQAHPGDQDSQIIMHVRMLDRDNVPQQEALGIVGVNLIYGACYLSHTPDRLLESLLDGLSTERVEIDMIEFSGIEFRRVDNRVMSLRLVQLGLTPAAMFASNGAVLQPSEALYKRPVLVQRGSFRPPTLVNAEMQRAAWEQFGAEPDVDPERTYSILEITMSNLRAEGEVDVLDFLSRVEILERAGFTVMISDYSLYYRLAQYLARCTQEKIGLVLGAGSMLDLFTEEYYAHLDGGILEGLGRLFKDRVKLYVYPMRGADPDTLITVDTLNVGGELDHLYRHLIDRGVVAGLECADRAHLDIYSKDVLKKIRTGDPSWREMVPPGAIGVIESKRLFGYRA